MHPVFSQISIQNGGLFVKSGVIELNDASITNNASLVMDAGTELNCTGVAVDFNGNSMYKISELSVNTNIRLYTDISISNNISFGNGIVDMGDQQILLSGQLLNESASSYLTASGSGYVSKLFSLENNTSGNPGNLGLSITPGSNLTDVTLNRGHETVFNEAEESIQRQYWFDSPLVLAGSVRFNYLEHELGILSEADLTLWASSSNSWEQIGHSSFDPIENYFENTVNGGYTNLSLFVRKPVSGTDIAKYTEDWGVYPNPVKSTLIINGIENGYYRFIDVTGKIIRSGEIEKAISLENLQKGIYIMQLNDGDESKTIRIIKE